MTMTHYDEARPYTTKDGSTVRELMHPARHGNGGQSLAEAIVPVGSSTRLHWHARSEEIYHISSGAGEMRLGDRTFPVRAGDTIAIPPGVPHRIDNTGPAALRILCCCAPAYAHDDTFLVDGQE